MAIVGSRNRGDANTDSDLDVVVEYKGDAREDDMFNVLNEIALIIENIEIDINPINADKTGTLSEYLTKSKEYDRRKLENSKPNINPQDNSTPKYGENNKLVSADRYEELKKRAKAKLNNLNSGFDPEMLAIGTEMAMFHIEAGASKFKDFAQRMISDLGEVIAPYLKAFYNGAKSMPGMDNFAKTTDSYDYVTNFDINELTQNQNDTTAEEARASETIGIETEAIEAASVSISDSIESVGDNQQAAGELRKTVFDAIDKVESLIMEVDKSIKDLQLTGVVYSTDGIEADYPINVLSKGPIKKDATKYVKAVAELTGLDFDINSKGKQEVLNVNIAPAGGDVSFILWSKANPEYGVYVSVPFQPDYNHNGYDNYHVPTDKNYLNGSILWGVTTKAEKYKVLSYQYVPTDITSGELAETLIKGINSHLKSIGLEGNEKN